MSDVTWQPGVTLEQIEKQVIQKALRFYQGNKEQTARALGVSTKTIFNKVQEYEGEVNGSVEIPSRDTTDNAQVETRVHAEPAKKVSKEHSVSMRKR